jgi:hypothetical protein
MMHKLSPQEYRNDDIKFEIYVLELDNETVNIGIERTEYANRHLSSQICVNLNKKELHSLIGTLLHVQAKMKGGSNG